MPVQPMNLNDFDGELNQLAMSAEARPFLAKVRTFIDEEVLPMSVEFHKLDANKTDGVMWDLEVEDVAARVDLDSASPQVIANMTGLVTRIARPTEAEARELEVNSTAAFEDAGFLWTEGEFLSYQGRERDQFLECVRGLFVEKDEDDDWITDGPRPPAFVAQ